MSRNQVVTRIRYKSQSQSQSLIAKPYKEHGGWGRGWGYTTHRVKQQCTHMSSNEAGSGRQHAPNGLPIRL